IDMVGKALFRRVAQIHPPHRNRDHLRAACFKGSGVLGVSFILAGADDEARRILFTRDDKRCVFHHPPPTNCTISSPSPSCRRISAHKLFGAISRLRSTATRRPSIPNRASRSTSVAESGASRISPLTVRRIGLPIRPDLEPLEPGFNGSTHLSRAKGRCRT